MKTFIYKYKKNFSVVISSVAAVLMSLFENWIYDQAKEWVREIEEGQKIIIGIIIGSLILVFMIFVFIISRVSIFLYEKVFPDSSYNEHLQEAFIAQKAMFAKRQEELQDEILLGRTNQDIQISQANKNIQFAIDCCYSFFEKAYTNSNSMVSDIRFEVTFMTISYKDGGITVPYSCNKEKRQPNSMLSRGKDPSLYNGTETAKLYDEYHSGKKPQMRIIEDTNAENSNYQEVYEGQRKRIRSTIIFPVFSHRNELLGTIVVHCDKENFFRKTQYRFWEELMEIFSVDIGYFKLILDDLQKNSNKNDSIF